MTMKDQHYNLIKDEIADLTAKLLSLVASHNQDNDPIDYAMIGDLLHVRFELNNIVDFLEGAEND